MFSEFLVLLLELLRPVSTDVDVSLYKVFIDDVFFCDVLWDVFVERTALALPVVLMDVLLDFVSFFAIKFLFLPYG